MTRTGLFGESGLVVFLCVANSARSQMAEGLARSIAPSGVEVASAGSAPGHLHPAAVAVLAEWSIDASQQFSKPIDAIESERVTHTITLCGEEVCPVFSGDVIREHWPLPDPAGHGEMHETTLAAFRAVRDELDRRVRVYFAAPTRRSVPR